jgi:endogenous inhibitor of DNA gyrase (YacG/DUF329 family)
MEQQVEAIIKAQQDLVWNSETEQFPFCVKKF